MLYNLQNIILQVNLYMKIILKLPTLYITTSLKKRFWDIWVEEHIINKNKQYFISRKYGIIGGKITIPEKKEMGTESNAITYARSLWRKKLESGFFQNINLSKSKMETVKPMGAYKLDNFHHKIKYPAFVQRKLDGFRCLCHINDKKEVIMYSKNMKPFIFLNHIKDEINKIKNLINNHLLYLDGELYEKGLRLHEISSLVMKKYATKEQEIEMKKISYYIFDIFDINNLSLTFKERYEILQNIFKKYKFKYIKLVSCYVVNNLDEIRKLDQDFLIEGYEGIIVRNMDGIYKLNSKSYDVLRTKEFKKKEFIIIGANQGSGTQKGAIIWNLQCIFNKKLSFSAISIGSIKDRIKLFKEYSKNPNNFIGKKAKVKYLSISDEGCIIRNPIVEEIIL